MDKEMPDSDDGHARTDAVYRSACIGGGEQQDFGRLSYRKRENLLLQERNDSEGLADAERTKILF